MYGCINVCIYLRIVVTNRNAAQNNEKRNVRTDE